MTSRTPILVATLAVVILSTAGCSASTPTTPAQSDPVNVATPPASEPSPTEPDTTTTDGSRNPSDEQIIMNVDGDTYTVNLYDNPTAASLLDRLPLTVSSDNYPGYDEKVLRLEDGLSMQDAPAGDDPLWPELGWYEPGQWIAIYYGHIGYYSGKVPLGTIDATTDELSAIPVGATIAFELSSE